MLQKSVFQTLFALFAWLFLQNFNYAPENGANFDQNKAKTETKNSEHAYKIKKVVLDAGHGGKDPGCIGVGKTREKHNALAIVLALGEKIKSEFPDIEVIYTRSTDVFIELNERAAIANRNNADLFISVHCNAMSVSSAHGTETYVMGLHTAKHNLEVAKRENASIYLEDNYQKNYEGYEPDSPEAHILGSVWQSSYLEQSILFAQYVQQYAHTVAKRDDRGVKQAGFLVLRETAMPSVLVEAGYLTNSKEETYLASDEGREAMATSIFNAFKDYKAKMEESTVDIVDKPKPVPQNNPGVAAKKNPGASAPSKPAATAKPVVASQKQPVNQAPATKPVVNMASTTNSFNILLLSWPGPLDKNSGKLALLSNVVETKNGGEYQYFYGEFKSKDEAEKMLSEIKNMGFKTARIEQKK